MTLADVAEAFARLSPSDLDDVARVLTRLTGGSLIEPGAGLLPTKEWHTYERHAELIGAYLAISGWYVERTVVPPTARVVHAEGRHGLQMTKLEALCYVVARLAYDDAMHRVSETDACRLTVGQIRERLMQAGMPQAETGGSKLRPALARLRDFDLIDYGSGFMAEEDDAIDVQPLIVAVQTNAEWEAYCATLHRWKEERSARSAPEAPLESFDDPGVRLDTSAEIERTPPIVRIA